jgi:hypothetical protein
MAEFKGYRCDDCGDITENGAKLKVEDIADFARNTPPYTFCSYDCLAAWAIAQNDKRRESVEGPPLGWAGTAPTT